jgi:Flp pilus assembly protein TadG
MNRFAENIKRCEGFRRRQRGLAMVESIIVLPVVLLLMLAVAELGNAILQYNALTQFVRDGARYAANAAASGSSQVVDLEASDIAETANLVAYGTITAGSPLLPGLDAGDVTVTDLGDGNISVAVSYAYQPLFAGGIPNTTDAGNSIGGGFTLNAEVIMRVLL